MSPIFSKIHGDEIERGGRTFSQTMSEELNIDIVLITMQHVEIMMITGLTQALSFCLERNLVAVAIKEF